MKFILIVEGDTEQRVLNKFLKKWLDPKLNSPAGIQLVNLAGNGDVLTKIVSKAIHYFNEPKQSSDIIAVIGLLDLYGLPSDFYSANPAMAAKSAQERYEWGKGELEKKVNHPKFRQFFAVHETEAWLLSQPDNKKFPEDVKKALKAHRNIKQPETINFDRPPAYLLKDLYYTKTVRTYKKTTNGSRLFETLNPEEAYKKCPNLKVMLDEMLKMAQVVGL